MKYSIVMVGLLISLGLYGDSGLRYYEKGYKLEKEYPLYSIPLYEKAIANTNDTKLKSIAATRLYYQYKKSRKFPDLIVHYSKYHSLLSIGKEHENSITEICKIYKISREEFYKIYPLLSRINSEEIGNLLEILTNQNRPDLFVFVYSFLMSQKKYEELRTIMFYLPEDIAPPILRLGLIVKWSDENSPQAGERFLEREDITTRDRSDTYYLLGQYYLQTGNYAEAERNFGESQKWDNPSRAVRERGKLLILQGRVEEACRLSSYPPRPYHETDHLLYLVCRKGSSLPSEIKDSVRILNEKEENPFLKASIPLL